MNVGEIKNAVMFQTNNDADDVGEFLPYLMRYINDGYDRLVNAYAQVHPTPEHDMYRPLRHDNDIPAMPDWTHKAIADWATWLVYRNGNPQKQQRGYVFRNAAEDIFSRVRDEGGDKGRVKNFFNIPQ